MYKRIILLLSLLIGLGTKTLAQNDPALAAMILVYTEVAEKQLKKQEAAMTLMTTGHIWTRDEVQKTYRLQEEFNDYLDSFRSVLSYAAQIYGFYHEVGKLTDNMESLTQQLRKSPENAVAVALSSRRNQIYRDLIMDGVGIVNDVRMVCLSDNKMTEGERMQLVFAIRPKLSAMNRRLQRLTKAVKYTSMGDVWLEIQGGARPPADKERITKSAMDRWKHIGRTVRP